MTKKQTLILKREYLSVANLNPRELLCSQLKGQSLSEGEGGGFIFLFFYLLVV